MSPSITSLSPFGTLSVWALLTNHLSLLPHFSAWHSGCQEHLPGNKMAENHSWLGVLRGSFGRENQKALQVRGVQAGNVYPYICNSNSREFRVVNSASNWNFKFLLETLPVFHSCREVKQEVVDQGSEPWSSHGSLASFQLLEKRVTDNTFYI